MVGVARRGPRLHRELRKYIVDGERVVTLRGDNIAAEFRQIVDDYVAKKYPARAGY